MTFRRLNNDLDHYAREAITQLLGLQLRAGASEKSLHELVGGCVESASRAARGRGVQEGLDLHRLGSVLRTWHRENAVPNSRRSAAESSCRRKIRFALANTYPLSKAKV